MNPHENPFGEWAPLVAVVSLVILIVGHWWLERHDWGKHR